MKFKASNNEVKYKALLADLQLAMEVSLTRIQVFSDSQVVVGQVTGQFEAKEEYMVKYLNLIKDVISKFKIYNIARIGRSKNFQVDALAKMASNPLGGRVSQLSI